MVLALWKKGYLAVMTAFFLLYTAVLVADMQPLADYGDILELVGIGIALCAFATGIHALEKANRLPWICFALTAFCSFLGEGLWSYYDHVLGDTPGSPSICDIFYVSYSIFCIAGIVVFLRQNKHISLSAFSADLVISLVAAAGLMYIFLILPTFNNMSQMSGALLLQISYPVFDFGILFGSMVIFFSAGRDGYSRSSLTLMLLGFLVMLIADQLNLLSELHDFNIVPLIEPMWPLAYCLLGTACITAAEENVTAKHTASIALLRREKGIEIARMLMPYIITFTALGVVFVQYKLFNFVFCWAMFLIIILSIRQFSVLMMNKRMNRELLKLNRKVTREAQKDFLTKLANRRHIDDVLAQLHREKEEQPLGLLFIDVDMFKTINDTYGHDVGDRTLHDVADAIRSAIRNADIAGRFGGDEFIAILPGADVQTVSAVGQRIIKSVRENTVLAAMHVTVSLGGASIPPGGDINTLLKVSDQALYKAKEAGRNRIIIAGA